MKQRKYFLIRSILFTSLFSLKIFNPLNAESCSEPDGLAKHLEAIEVEASPKNPPEEKDIYNLGRELLDKIGMKNVVTRSFTIFPSGVVVLDTPKMINDQREEFYIYLGDYLYNHEPYWQKDNAQPQIEYAQKLGEAFAKTYGVSLVSSLRGGISSGSLINIVEWGERKEGRKYFSAPPTLENPRYGSVGSYDQSAGFIGLISFQLSPEQMETEEAKTLIQKIKNFPERVLTNRDGSKTFMNPSVRMFERRLFPEARKAEFIEYRIHPKPGKTLKDLAINFCEIRGMKFIDFRPDETNPYNGNVAIMTDAQTFDHFEWVNSERRAPNYIKTIVCK
ncbi:MAG: hypothetical protein J0L93_09665 [Deltaproteobacteria bacterium]|nr:hypothetical protein [Deltaproteobacteria bacterium]